MDLKKSDVNSLVNFFSNLSGFQRTNRFRVDITPPSGSALDNTVLFASMVQLPQQVVTYFPDTVSPSAPMVDVPIKREYDERFIIDFIVDKNWKARSFFDKWMDYMFKYNKNGSQKGGTPNYVKYYSEIVGTVDIYALDTSSNTNQRITLHDAFPSTIIPSQLMNDAPNDYLTLSVDMNYRYYTTNKS